MLLILSSNLEVYANPDTFFKNIVESKTTAEIDKIISQANTLSFGEMINRELENGYKQEIRIFDYFYGNHFKKFQINIISKEGVIFFGQVLQFHWKNRIEKNEVFIMHPDKLVILKDRFNEIYTTNYQLEEFIEYLNTLYVYSFGCGDAMAYKPKQATKTLTFIKTRNKRQLLKWLKTPNKELQAYAVFGLIRLKKAGIKLTTENNRILDYVIDQNVRIHNCAGCIAGLNTPLKELVEIEE